MLANPGRRQILNRIMVILEKENHYKTHYDVALKEAVEDYFSNTSANHRLAAMLKTQPARVTKSARRGGFKSRGC